MADQKKAESAAAKQAAEFVGRAVKSFEFLRIPQVIDHPDTGPAQKLLRAAWEAVMNMQFSMLLVRAVGRDLEDKDHRGRVSDSDADLLRAMIAYAGAGLDASLKQLIRDTVRDLIRTRDDCRKKFLEFTRRHLVAAGTTPSIDIGRLTEVLADDRLPQEVLFEKYEWELTGDSLQSVEQVERVCGALGITDKELRMRIKEGTLDRMFKGRNQIVHELDLNREGGRTSRSLKDARVYAVEALSVAQLIINEVAKLLPSKEPTPPTREGAVAASQARGRPQEV